MTNITKYAVGHRSITWFFLVVMLLGGLYAFDALGKKEDSTFVIKSAIVSCRYPGATPEEVESSIVIPLERELHTLANIHKISSEAHFGYARLVVELQPSLSPERIPQLWDELRAKVANVEPLLPEGAGEISVADDFGDVYGLYYALASDGGFSWSELRDKARDILTQLYTVEGVEKVLLYGEQQPVVNVVISPSILAAFDLRPDDIAKALSGQNAVVDIGIRRAGEVDIYLAEGTTYNSIADVENQLLTASDHKQYRLGDIAHIERSYREPQSVVMRVDGRRAIGIAVASDPQLDIVGVGDNVQLMLGKISEELPAGMTIETLYPENDIARQANNDFLANLLESLAIVILLVMLTMGWRSGVVVGSSLLFAIGGTLLVMLLVGEGLNRTSLAGFIIAMGMLVDNAIVVTDNTQMLIGQGVTPYKASIRGATEPRWGLLAATIVAILSFLPLQLAPSSVAEIIQPLSVVVGLSLLHSWVLSITQVPMMCVDMVRGVRVDGEQRSRWFYLVVRRVLQHRWTTIIVAILLFLSSLWAMGRMPQNFFPQLDKPYFRADVLLPEGYDIATTDATLQRLTAWLKEQNEVKCVSSTAGATPPRYYLASSSYANRPNFGNLLVELHSSDDTADVEQRFAEWVEANEPDVWLRSSLFKLSPVPDAVIEFGFVGDNADTLARLTHDAMQIMERNGGASNIRNSWGNRVALWQPRYSQIKAQRLGVERGAMLRSLELATSGLAIAEYREDDLTLPILLRTETPMDSAITALETMPVFSRSGNSYSVEQAAAGFDFGFVGSVIKRQDSERVMMAQCDPRRGVNTIRLLESLRKDIEKEVVIPDGYRLELFGEEESREESNRALASELPTALLLIFIVLLLLFGSLRSTIVVVITLPLIFVGVVLGLLLTGNMFDFFSLLGLLGLVGMNVKNGVILLTHIERVRASGIAPIEAVAHATADRFIPVVTASGTTVLGMVPLLFDSLFRSMAATIMGGLVVATLLVLLLLPTVYSLIYRIKQ